MCRRNSDSLGKGTPLVLLVGVFICLSLPVQSSDNDAIVTPLVSDQLLSSPITFYQRLSETTETIDSPHDLLQLALVQHLLGLNRELKATLKRVPLAHISEHPRWQILYSFLIGASASKDAQYDQAAQALSDAKTLAEQQNARRLWTLATQELAFNEAIQERFESAFLLLQEAYLGAQQHQGQFELALVEQTLGGVYSYADNFEQALNYYHQALDRYKALQFPSYNAETLLGIATTLRHQQQWPEALQAYEDYHSAIAFQENRGGAFYYHYGKGITLALSGRCSDATKEINAAVQAQGPRDYLGELYKKQASCAAKNGLVNDAQSALDNAKNIINTSPGLLDTLWQAELTMIESEIAEASSDFPMALQLFQQYHATASRLQAKKSSERLLEVKSTLESERKDAQILQLKQQSELQSLQLITQETQKQRSALIIGSAVLVLLMLTVIIYLLRRKTQQLYALSVHDPLTNLFNRRHAIAVIEHWLEQDRSERQLFSVLMIDIDQFKPINDTYGHSVGDKLLIAITNAASLIVRPSDILARFGGEEFICVLPRTSPSEAEIIADRLRTAIAETVILLNDGKELSRTVSIGIAHVNQRDVDINAILERADKAMYEAKKRGRDQLCVSKS